MDNLNIDAGAVELTIDGDENRVIRFYPTDVGFVEGYFQLVQELEKKQKEISDRENEITAKDIPILQKHMESVQLRKEVFLTIRQCIDNVFGEGTSQTVFGDKNSISLAVRFFRGITPYVVSARKQEIERYTTPASEVMG